MDMISEKISNMVFEKIIPGASWSFITPEGCVNHYAGRIGVCAPFSEKAVREGMAYDLASLTKIIGTTTRILQLIDEGQLTLMSPVNEVIPEFATIKVSIQDLLLHKGGFPADFSKKEKEDLTKTVLHAYFKSCHLADSSYKTIYSDIGFLLLGEIIKAIDGVSLEQSFQTTIFQPLEMGETSYHLSDPTKAIPTEWTAERGFVQGEAHDSKAYKLETEVGSAGLFSTLPDINKFVSAYLEKDTRLFTSELFDKVRNTNVQGRSYGWEQKQGKEAMYLFHTGFTGTSIGLDMERKKGFVLLTNRIHPTREDRGFIKARAALYSTYF